MLTGLLEGHVTRLATPPDPRHPLTSPPESGEEGSGSSNRHQRHQRPPPVPRPRTLEGSEIVPHRRLYSPGRDALPLHRRSREVSLDRGTREPPCCGQSLALHHHHCDCSSHCYWDDDDPGDYSPPGICTGEQHRHSYHEGLQHAHLHHCPPQRHIQRRGTRSSSPCYSCRTLGSLNSLAECGAGGARSHALAYKVGVTTPPTQSQDYIPLWKCHSPPVRDNLDVFTK